MECTWAPHGCGAISVFVCVCDSMTTTPLWLCWINSTHAEKRTQQTNNCCRLARKQCRPAAPVSSPGHQAITLPKELHDPASVLVGQREDKWDWVLSVSPEVPSCERLDRTEHGRVKCRGTELAGGFSSRHRCGVRAPLSPSWWRRETMRRLSPYTRTGSSRLLRTSKASCCELTCNNFVFVINVLDIFSSINLKTGYYHRCQ